MRTAPSVPRSQPAINRRVAQVPTGQPRSARLPLAASDLNRQSHYAPGMIPWRELDRARASGGGELSLHQRGQELVIRIDGKELMSSRQHASEERLAELSCAGFAQSNGVRILVGGLGMGYTLRATLDQLGPDAEVVVAEISASVVDWNRRYLGHLADAPLDDSRVTAKVADVSQLIRTTRVRFDAILLDIDNGPEALTRRGNHALYTTPGLAALLRALRPGGCMGLWSAARHDEFERRLHRVGFEVSRHTARARRGRSGAKHVIYLGRAPTCRLWPGKRD